MTKVIEVSDSTSNAEEQIERAVKTIGLSPIRRRIFEAIYYHKARIKTVGDVVKRTGLSRMQVLQNGRPLVKNGIAKPATRDGETAYEMIDFFHANKRVILKLIGDPARIAAIPTKRKSVVSVTVKSGGRTAVARPKAELLTVDDIDSFDSVHALSADGNIPRTVSENQFKHGIQSILGERAEWKDWGGELADLVSARVVYKGTRIGAVFAFKGPGQRGPLVPGKMGKNGDQIQRLFIPNGRLFVVQYVGDIRHSIGDLMHSLALAKSNAIGDIVYYMTIDGTDSYRLFRAYADHFGLTAAPVSS